MNSVNPKIASVGISVPPCCVSQLQAIELIKKYYTGELHSGSMQMITRMLRHPSIQKRHFAVDDPDVVSVLKNEDCDKRIQRFTHWARLLGAEAIRNALDKVNLTARDIDALIVNTCTGYICPGLSTYLIEEIGLRKNIKAYDLVGSGCGGALPNLQMASNYCISNPDNIALSVSIEICSATFQMKNDVSLLVSNSIFGDGAAAAVVWNRASGLHLADSDQIFLPEFRDDIRYIYQNGQLHNQLSKRLPQLIGQNIGKFTSGLISKNKLSIDDIDFFCIHPGGSKILDVCADALSLDQRKMKFSRDILTEYGNLSSPTVLLVLNKIIPDIGKGQWCLLLAFGAGLSIYGWLLKRE
jgi:predicted naringenin-chalcone synthase